MIAAVQSGVFASLAEADAAWVRPLLRAPVRPDPDLGPLYDRLYPAFREGRALMQPLWHSQARNSQSSTRKHIT